MHATRALSKATDKTRLLQTTAEIRAMNEKITRLMLEKETAVLSGSASMAAATIEAARIHARTTKFSSAFQSLAVVLAATIALKGVMKGLEYQKEKDSEQATSAARIAESTSKISADYATVKEELIKTKDQLSLTKGELAETKADLVATESALSKMTEAFNKSHATPTSWWAWLSGKYTNDSSQRTNDSTSTPQLR